MKLFHQLDPDQQDNAIHYNLHTVLHDLLETEEVHFGTDDPDDEDEIRIKEKIKSILEQCKTMGEDIDAKMDLLMEDEEVNSILHHVAYEISKTCWYADDSECVIYEGEITDEEDGEIKEDDMLVVAKDDKKMLN